MVKSLLEIYRDNPIKHMYLYLFIKLMNTNVVKLDEQNLFAFELQKELNWIRYFSVKNNKKRYFFDDENTDFPLIFVVGTED